MHEMKCLKCGGIIDYDAILNHTVDEDKVIDYCVGHCVDCDAEYQWEDVYEFTGQVNLREVSSN